MYWCKEAREYQREVPANDVWMTLRVITEMMEQIMATLDDLKAAVEKAESVQESAVTLIQGLAAKLDAAANGPGGVDEAAVKDLAAELNASSDALSAAVTANTPAAPAQADPAPSADASGDATAAPVADAGVADATPPADAPAGDTQA